MSLCITTVAAGVPSPLSGRESALRRLSRERDDRGTGRRAS